MGVLDLKAVTLMAMVTAASLTLTALLIGRLDPTQRWFRSWAWGAASVTVGMLALAVRFGSDDTYLLWLGNSLVIVGFTCYYQGNRGMLDLPHAHWPWWFVAVAVPLQGAFIVVTPSTVARMLAMAVSLSVLLISSAADSWRNRLPVLPLVSTLSGLLYGLGAVMFAVSVLVGIAGPRSFGVDYTSGWVVELPYAISILFSLWLGVVLTLTLGARAQADLTAARDEAEAVAGQLVLANAELATLSVTDRLTGLANRRRLDDVLAGELARFERYGTPVSVVLMDIDRFKRVNDTYGHSVGDQVLVAVASLLSKSVRATDIAGRWGGEEFLLVLPETPLGAAVTMAEAIRSRMAECDFDQVGAVTASFGVAEAETGSLGLVERADAALYAAKGGGRNQVAWD